MHCLSSNSITHYNMTAGGHMLPFIFSSGGSSLDAASSLDTLG